MSPEEQTLDPKRAYRDAAERIGHTLTDLLLAATALRELDTTGRPPGDPRRRILELRLELLGIKRALEAELG